MSIKNVPHFLRLLIELLLIAALLFLVQFFKQLWPKETPTLRGFFCDDANLQYPYHKSTVTHTSLNILGLYLPLAVIITIELGRYFAIKWQRNNKKESNCCLTTKISEEPQLLQLYHAVCTFLLGYACERLFKQVGKFTIGRLRPHFLAVCQPQLPDGSTCAHAINQGRYIMQYTCLGVNSTAKMLHNLHVSFPSGHSSMIFYGMVFLALYLQRSLVGRVGHVFRPILQLLCLMVAWFVALSRVMDYMHHWSDVLAGAIMGTAIAVFIFFMRYWVYGGEQQVVASHNLECCSAASKSNAVLSEVLSEKSEKAPSVISVVINEKPERQPEEQPEEQQEKKSVHVGECIL